MGNREELLKAINEAIEASQAYAWSAARFIYDTNTDIETLSTQKRDAITEANMATYDMWKKFHSLLNSN